MLFPQILSQHSTAYDLGTTWARCGDLILDNFQFINSSPPPPPPELSSWLLAQRNFQHSHHLTERCLEGELRDGWEIGSMCLLWTCHQLALSDASLGTLLVVPSSSATGWPPFPYLQDFWFIPCLPYRPLLGPWCFFTPGTALLASLPILP